MMIIDKDKLAKIIEASVKETAKGYWTAESSLIGAWDDMQVHIVVTKDGHDFIDEPNPGHICIKDGTES